MNVHLVWMLLAQGGDLRFQSFKALDLIDLMPFSDSLNGK